MGPSEVVFFLPAFIRIEVLILIRKGGTAMKKYVCTVCGYVYDPAEGDPDNGVAPGTAFEDVPEDWVCPVCAVAKDMFEPEE